MNLKKTSVKEREAEYLPLLAVKWLITLSVLLGVILLVSNLAALKIWQIKFPFPVELWSLKKWRWIDVPVDAGIWLFPISYVVGDLLVYIFGERIADQVALCSAGFTALSVVIFWLLDFLPDFPGADNAAFLVVRAGTGRIFMASVVGFIASQIINNRCFVVMRRSSSDLDPGLIFESESDGYRRWSFRSSVVAHLVDAATFEVFAFVGKLSPCDFLSQVAFAFVAGIIIERLMLSLSERLAEKSKSVLRFTDGHEIDKSSFR